jgi:hypothetical protein
VVYVDIVLVVVLVSVLVLQVLLQVYDSMSLQAFEI